MKVMTQEKQVLQAIRNQLPVRWGKALSFDLVRKMAIELGFIEYLPPWRRRMTPFRVTETGRKFALLRDRRREREDCS